MIHAILEDLLTPEQARNHLQLIDAHLRGPDGVRLFDKPMPYHGGPMRFFQRAESATFFGREIGLMYMHAHLRYAQALAHVGEADRFFHALCQANPIGIRAIVSPATLRQANCYYSSSDAAFADRYEASAEYQRVVEGRVDLDGGWRIYSSGAGIALGLIVRRFLGLSPEATALSVDPVIPSALDGLKRHDDAARQADRSELRGGREGMRRQQDRIERPHAEVRARAQSVSRRRGARADRSSDGCAAGEEEQTGRSSWTREGAGPRAPRLLPESLTASSRRRSDSGTASSTWTSPSQSWSFQTRPVLLAVVLTAVADDHEIEARNHHDQRFAESPRPERILRHVGHRVRTCSSTTARRNRSARWGNCRFGRSSTTGRLAFSGSGVCT